MTDDRQRAEINMAKIPVSGDLSGLLFALGTVLIFYWGVPELRYWVPWAILLGCLIALGLRLVRHGQL